MTKNTPRVNRHPKTGKVLNNPPKIKHEEKTLTEVDYPLIDYDKKGYIEAKKEREQIQKVIEKREKEKDKKYQERIQDENKIMIVIPTILLFGPFINSFLSGCIALFLTKDIDHNQGIKNVYMFIAFLEIFVPIIISLGSSLILS